MRDRARVNIATRNPGDLHLLDQFGADANPRNIPEAVGAAHDRIHGLAVDRVQHPRQRPLVDRRQRVVVDARQQATAGITFDVVDDRNVDAGEFPIQHEHEHLFDRAEQLGQFCRGFAALFGERVEGQTAELAARHNASGDVEHARGVGDGWLHQEFLTRIRVRESNPTIPRRQVCTR